MVPGAFGLGRFGLAGSAGLPRTGKAAAVEPGGP
jgi:hypothetical protein